MEGDPVTVDTVLIWVLFRSLTVGDWLSRQPLNKRTVEEQFPSPRTGRQALKERASSPNCLSTYCCSWNPKVPPSMPPPSQNKSQIGLNKPCFGLHL